jgi:hypothetical protein
VRQPPPIKQPAYKRPAINLSPVNREWREVEVGTLLEGDIVAEFGKLSEVRHGVGTGPDQWDGVAGVIVVNVDNERKYFVEYDKVLAFVRR